MSCLGTTELHQIVDEQSGSKLTPDGQAAAEQHLLYRRHGILISDIAHLLGVPPADQNKDLLIFGIFACSPRKVLAAFDQVRQDELDWTQGVEVSLRSSDRQLAAMLELIKAIEARDAGDTERTMRRHSKDIGRAAMQIRKALRPHRRDATHFDITLD